MPALLDELRQYTPPATGLTTGSSGGGLNLQAYLAADPVLRAQMLGITGNVASRLAGYDEQKNADLIRFGYIPEGYDVNQTTRTAAEQATAGGLSTWAQLADAARRTQSATVGSLGARGAIRSGAFGQHSIQNQRDYNVAKASALDALQQQRYAYTQQGLQAQQEGLGQRVTAEQDALERLFTMINSGIIGVPGAQTKTGGGGAAPTMKPYPSLPGYNPTGYVPGGASPTVASAIQARALQGPLNASSYNPRGYVPGGAAPRAGAAIQQQASNPSTFLPGLNYPGGVKVSPYGRAPLG